MSRIDVVLRSEIDAQTASSHLDGFGSGSDRKGRIKRESRVRIELVVFALKSLETRRFHAHGVGSERNGVEVEFARRAGFPILLVRRIVGLEDDFGISDRMMLRIVHHTAHVAEDGRGGDTFQHKDE